VCPWHEPVSSRNGSGGGESGGEPEHRLAATADEGVEGGERQAELWYEETRAVCVCVCAESVLLLFVPRYIAVMSHPL